MRKHVDEIKNEMAGWLIPQMDEILELTHEVPAFLTEDQRELIRLSLCWTVASVNEFETETDNN